MNFDDRLKGRFQFVVDNSMVEILRHVAERKKTSSWSDLLTESIDFDEITIGKDELVINRRPAFFSPFRANGRIVFKIIDSTDSRTILEGETQVYSGYAILLLVAIIAFFSLWTAGVFLLTPDIINAWLMVAFAWIVFGLLMLIVYKVHRHGLLNYAKKIANELSDSEKASRQQLCMRHVLHCVSESA